jgi:hypothetical protein
MFTKHHSTISSFKINSFFLNVTALHVLDYSAIAMCTEIVGGGGGLLCTAHYCDLCFSYFDLEFEILILLHGGCKEFKIILVPTATTL